MDEKAILEPCLTSHSPELPFRESIATSEFDSITDQQALLVWPWLVIGTLVGTALLITLPIGAAVWWITLFLSRSAARLEVCDLICM